MQGWLCYLDSVFFLSRLRNMSIPFDTADTNACHRKKKKIVHIDVMDLNILRGKWETEIQTLDRFLRQWAVINHFRETTYFTLLNEDLHDRAIFTLDKPYLCSLYYSPVLF